MANDMHRVLIETIVKKTLKDLKDSPRRSARNLVNMALDFSEGRFQRTFFTMAQTMLENEQSPYYDLIEDAAAHMEPERALAFGMNLGYNSCTVGAKRIRELEAAYGFNIPWTIVLEMDERRLTKAPESYDSVIVQGEQLGIYTWMLYYHGRLQKALPLIRNHSDSAFVLFCEPEDITPEFLDCMADVKHLMLAVRYEESAENVYGQLREMQYPYSVYYVYKEADAKDIINGDLFYSIQQVHPLFSAVIPGPDCSEETRESVYNAIVAARENQTFQTIVWDMSQDNSWIDSIISDDSCSARFDKNGRLYISKDEQLPLTLFDEKLENIFRQAFPKQQPHTA